MFFNKAMTILISSFSKIVPCDMVLVLTEHLTHVPFQLIHGKAFKVKNSNYSQMTA